MSDSEALHAETALTPPVQARELDMLRASDGSNTQIELYRSSRLRLGRTRLALTLGPKGMVFDRVLRMLLVPAAFGGAALLLFVFGAALARSGFLFILALTLPVFNALIFAPWRERRRNLRIHEATGKVLKELRAGELQAAIETQLGAEDECNWVPKDSATERLRCSGVLLRAKIGHWEVSSRLVSEASNAQAQFREHEMTAADLAQWAQVQVEVATMSDDIDRASSLLIGLKAELPGSNRFTELKLLIAARALKLKRPDAAQTEALLANPAVNATLAARFFATYLRRGFEDTGFRNEPVAHREEMQRYLQSLDCRRFCWTWSSLDKHREALLERCLSSG